MASLAMGGVMVAPRAWADPRQPTVPPASADIGPTTSWLFDAEVAARLAAAAFPTQGATEPAARPALPAWLTFRGSHRTRYETIDHRYTLGEVGSDQQLAFRTRFQVSATRARAWATSELEDARVSLNDSASTITPVHVTGLKVLQAHVGLRQRRLAGSPVDAQVEVGRFSRDFGARRLIARNAFRNTTNAFDGVIGRVSGKTWAVQGLYVRPLVYAYPSLGFDDRFRGQRLGGVYVTSTRARSLNADAYLLRLEDGDRAPTASRRRLWTSGARSSGPIGSGSRMEYEVEVVGQWGQVGPRDHRAAFVHAHLGRQWGDRVWRPRLVGHYDHATGDADPNDARDGTFDTLLGARRFDLAPSGIYGLVARANLRAPALVVQVRPSATNELTLHYRGVWLDQARDRWRTVNLRDVTGRSGTFVGRQTELRFRQRWRQYFEFDGAGVMFEEGPFPRSLNPAPNGRTFYLTASVEARF